MIFVLLFVIGYPVLTALTAGWTMWMWKRNNVPRKWSGAWRFGLAWPLVLPFIVLVELTVPLEVGRIRPTDL